MWYYREAPWLPSLDQNIRATEIRDNGLSAVPWLALVCPWWPNYNSWLMNKRPHWRQRQTSAFISPFTILNKITRLGIYERRKNELIRIINLVIKRKLWLHGYVDPFISLNALWTGWRPFFLATAKTPFCFSFFFNWSEMSKKTFVHKKGRRFFLLIVPKY